MKVIMIELTDMTNEEIVEINELLIPYIIPSADMEVN